MNKLQEFRITSRLVALEPGLHIFRYATHVPAGQSIQLTLQATPVGKGQTDFFPAEGVSRNTLSRLGDCLIARVKSAAASILITEYRSGNATVEVDLRLDRIDTSPAITRDGTVEPRETADGGSNHESIEALQLSGRLSGHGPVHVPADMHDAWLGDPTGRSPLEGFCIAWAAQPAGVELIYTCRVHMQGQMPATRAGNYVGTSGTGLPIHSVSFLLAGPRADEYELSGQVAFSGHPPQALQPGLALAGPSGGEPLIALRPRIVAKPGPHAARSAGLADPSDRPATQAPAWSPQANT